MKEKDRAFLLDALILPSGLFGDAVNMVIDRFQEAKKQSAAFKQYLLPRRSKSKTVAPTGQPIRHQAPRTGRYKRRVSLLESIIRDLGSRGDTLTQSPLSLRSI